MKAKKQKNIQARKVEYKGVLFDSILELKFVILIEDRCSWIREPKRIYYDPITLKPTNYLTEKTKRYIPDFLVRKWRDNSAHIIEIKPNAFLNTEQMEIRKEVMNNYILANNLDWKFSILSENDLELNEIQKDRLASILGNNKIKFKLDFIQSDRKYNQTEKQYFSQSPILNTTDFSIEEYNKYVRYGIMPDWDLKSYGI